MLSNKLKDLISMELLYTIIMCLQSLNIVQHNCITYTSSEEMYLPEYFCW